ncbi:MAG: hypothetical protein AB1757_06135 [Acidobacteriota bacterium]
MATITNAKLTLTHDHNKKTVRAVVTCNVNFTALEQCQMKACPQARFFKLKCQLWGEDSGLTGADDFLFTYATVFFFPDPSPAATESRTFDVLLGEGVLDEDWGQDEVYGLLRLTNLGTLVEVKKKTNVVSHHF